MEKELREYFPTVIEEDGKETFRVNEAGLRRHALKVLDGIGLVVECLGDTERLQRVLRCLGVRHYHAGIKPEMLQVRPNLTRCRIKVDFILFYVLSTSERRRDHEE